MKGEIRKYSCMPKTDVKKSAIAVSACFISAICMLLVAENGWILARYFRILALVATFVGIMLSVRLFAYSYVYSICCDDESGELYLTVHRIKKNKSVKICDISLYDIAEIREFDLTKTKKDEKKPKRPRMDREKYKNCKMYNYCADIIPERYCLIRIEGNRAEYIKFSPDEAMIEMIKSAIY